jgi:hypothetical protein
MEYRELPIYAELSYDLLAAITVAGLIGWVILRRPLGGFFALTVVSGRLLIALVYFAWFVNPNWWLAGDSNKYVDAAILLLDAYEEGATLGKVFALSFHLDLPQFYVAHNVVAFNIFGLRFFSPIILNIVLVFTCSWMLFHLARLIIPGRGLRKGLVAFFVFHPTIISWTSFNNLKEILVVTLVLLLTLVTVGLLNQFSDLINQVRKIAKHLNKIDKQLDRKSVGECCRNVAKVVGFLMIAIFSLMALKNTRYYLIYLLPMLGFGWASYTLIVLRWMNNRLWNDRLQVKRILSLGVVVGGAASLGILAFNYFPPGYVKHLQLETGLFGILRMAVTPRPWMLTHEYSFLLIAASLHWILFGWTIIGCWMLWKRSIFGKWLIIYACGMLVAFGLTPEVAGPRHRFQIDFVVVIAQYMVVCAVLAASAVRLDASRNTRYG